MSIVLSGCLVSMALLSNVNMLIVDISADELHRFLDVKVACVRAFIGDVPSPLLTTNTTSAAED